MTSESMKSPLYVPILKGKEGEFAAVEALFGDAKLAILPLVEVPSIPFDYVNEQPSRTLEKHVGGLAARIQRAWKSERPIMLDLGAHCDEEVLSSGKHAFSLFAEEAQAEKLQVIPVLDPTSSHAAIDAAGEHASSSGLGVCVRLRLADFGEDVDVVGFLSGLLERLGLKPDETDIVVDFQEIRDVSQSILMFRAVQGILPEVEGWRRMILAAASFPEDLRDADAAATSVLPRLEWRLWKSLQARPDRLLRSEWIFADYGITHPMLKELDPRTMRMSASIRYTGPDEWVIVKGRNVRQYGFEQYFELASTLIRHPTFSGEAFSWGDSYIYSTAAKKTGPGNATTWRKVGTNHHLTLVAMELTKLKAGSL